MAKVAFLAAACELRRAGRRGSDTGIQPRKRGIGARELEKRPHGDEKETGDSQEASGQETRGEEKRF